MGFFKKIKKVAKRTVAAVATGGFSEVSRATGIAPGLPALAEGVFAPTSLGDIGTITGAIADPGGALASTLQNPNLTPSTGGSPMAGNFLGGLAGILGTTSRFGGAVGAVSQIGSGFLSGFLPAQGPIAGPAIQQPIVRTMAAGPVIRGAASAVAEFAAPILAKMSAFVGKSVSLRAAMIIIRRLGKFLQSPTAIATAVGLSVAELSSLLTAASLAGSQGRRMNVGNVKALRRAHRRIKGFHKLCGDNDTLRKPRSRRAPQKSITICK